MPDLEMWGGVECTVARIGDRFRNQVVETGHHARFDDIDRIAALGVRTLRYPILWETIAPDDPERRDWRWHDARLARLKALGIRVIAGLLHHGSGPRYTSLLDPAIPRLLAAHAAHTARRYPWIELFTPINEPLTTARLSCLYGHWYPHARDEHSFLRALVNQCEATRLAMDAVREITPSARLVQTEDIGKVFSTPRLSYQADFENARRWLSLDLLCGLIGREHLLYPFLLAHGIDSAELDRWGRHPCPPDIIGVNHYLTSERYLHPHTGAFPAQFSGGNGRERYADVEAVRMSVPQGQLGPAARLNDVWARYRLPMVVTEVHHGCTRDEQLRWLMEVWNAAEQVQRGGADVRAVTVWSMFGAVDWNSLLTRDNGCYEPGAFDVRDSPPRLTAIGQAVRSLARAGRFSHPVIADSPGWWRRPERLYRAPSRQTDEPRADSRRPVLVIGGDEQWRQASDNAARARGLAMVVLGSDGERVDDPAHLSSLLDRLHPWAMIDARTFPTQDIGTTKRHQLALACDRLEVQLALICDEPSTGGCCNDRAQSRDARPLKEHRGETVRDREAWTDAVLSVYAGPENIDAILDLLIDGARGLWRPTCGKLQFQDRPEADGQVQDLRSDSSH